jgi:tetratricopeptide (TPR) repeat protein
MEHPLTSRAKKRLIAAVVLIILILGVLGAYAARTALRQRMLARALDTGMAAYSRGDYAEGMKQLSVYVGRVQTDEEAILALADCRRNLSMENSKHLIRALSYARLAAEVAPKDTKPLKMMIELYTELGYATEAREAAEKLLALDPSHLDALRTRTQMWLAVGDGKEAHKSATDMVKYHPDLPEAHDFVVYAMQQLKEKYKPKDVLAYACQGCQRTPAQPWPRPC